MKSLYQHEIFKNLSEDIDKVLKLLAHGVGGRWAKILLNKSYVDFFIERKNLYKIIIFFLIFLVN